jgi:hypothetical protein
MGGRKMDKRVNALFVAYIIALVFFLVSSIVTGVWVYIIITSIYGFIAGVLLNGVNFKPIEIED